MKQLLTLFVIITAALALNACNTVSGVGRDVQAAGTAIQKSTK
jgi:entericidin B